MMYERLITEASIRVEWDERPVEDLLVMVGGEKQSNGPAQSARFTLPRMRYKLFQVVSDLHYHPVPAKYI